MTLNCSGQEETPVMSGMPVETDVDDGTLSQYVTFFLGDECFALEMKSVLEIIRTPDTVEVPLTPPALRGLANLRGSVLPVLDLRLALGLEEKEYDDATRVMVASCGRPIGLVVDRVARVLNIEDDKIETADSVRGTVSADVLTGVAKNVDGEDLIQLFDAARLVSAEYEELGRESASEAVGESTRRPVATMESGDDDIEDDLLQLVSFVVDDQEYAFEIAHVQEIVRVSHNISQVPRSDPHVLGLIDHRNKLLPIVSMRGLLALHDAPLEDRNRVIVFQPEPTTGADPSGPVGIVVDEVREVLRVSNDTFDSLPDLLAGGNAEHSQISGICRLNDGQRLVSVLSAKALSSHSFTQAALDTAQNCEENGDMIEAVADTSDDFAEEDLEDNSETQLVVFHLSGQEYGVEVETVQEIIRVPDRMNQMPKTPEYVEGLINLRGSVLPVVDLSLRIGLARVERNDHQRILVLNVEDKRAGFIVDSVTEVLRLPTGQIEDAPNLSPEQAGLLGRIAKLDNGKRIIPILGGQMLFEQGDIGTLVAELEGALEGHGEAQDEERDNSGGKTSDEVAEPASPTTRTTQAKSKRTSTKRKQKPARKARKSKSATTGQRVER